MGKRSVRPLVLLAAVATLLMAGTVSAEPAVEIGEAADLVAGGAQVDVPVTVSCDSGGSTGVRTLSVQVRQAGGDVVDSGSAYVDNLTCDGSSEEVTVPVLADVGSRPFRAGDAAVQATLMLCEFGPRLLGGGQEPSPGQVTPPEDPSPEPPAPVPPPGDVVAPCQTAMASGVVFVHPRVAGERPGLP